MLVRTTVTRGHSIYTVDIPNPDPSEVVAGRERARPAGTRVIFPSLSCSLIRRRPRASVDVGEARYGARRDAADGSRTDVGRPRKRGRSALRSRRSTSPAPSAGHRPRRAGRVKGGQYEDAGEEQSPCDRRAIRLSLPRSSTVTTDPARQQVGSSTTPSGRIPKLMTPRVVVPSLPTVHDAAHVVGISRRRVRGKIRVEAYTQQRNVIPRGGRAQAVGDDGVGEAV